DPVGPSGPRPCTLRGALMSRVAGRRRGDANEGEVVLMGRTAGFRLCISFTAAVLIALLVPTLASAHIERASYWPDPAPDCSVQPCAGGEVPTPRSLASAVTGKDVTRVVCQRDSVRRLQRSIET